jgi:phospholipid/cholesterol/gamma-HCH transport system substrate-binding protein
MPTTYPTAFAERNKIAIALIGMLAMALVFALTFNAAALPIIGGGKVYTAQFAEAGGLKEGNEVRVAGVKVGKVTDISLDGAVVSVRFRAEVDRLGDQTTASVKVKTMLGQKFLALDPLGSTRPSPTFPTRSRRSTPTSSRPASRP